MSISEPFPGLDEILTAIGEAGQRLSDIDACEGAAGNISVCMGWNVEARLLFPTVETITLPQPAPELKGKTILVTGSGRRLRDILKEPTANMGVVIVHDDGQTATLYTNPNRLFDHITSEFNSHLAVHNDQIKLTGTNFHAIIHAQPTYITYLSHIPRYRNEPYLNSHLMRWEPEFIMNLPKGIGVVPFEIPGSDALKQATVNSLRNHRVVLWCKHGVMARSEISAKRASDRIEYVETSARYEYLNLVNGEQADGLSQDELLQICVAFEVDAVKSLLGRK